jgi:16S rRNA (cytidine1402-2'-O)-methyltransferase
MMALMASGLNGQQFAFNGYLPVKPEARRRRIKELEKRSGAEGQTQLFIETPYRNGALMNDLLDTCMGSTRLTLAIDLTSPGSFICTLTVEEWEKNKPDFEGKWHKKPCVFIIQA